MPKPTDREVQLEPRRGPWEAFAAAYPDLAFVVDENGRFLDFIAGDRSEDLLYEDPEAFIDRAAHDVFPEEIADLQVAVIRDAIGSGETRRYEYSLDIDNRARRFEAVIEPVPSRAGGSDVAVWVARDVTERHERERELTRQRAMLEAQQETVLDGLLVVDDDGEIRSFNERFVEMWAIPEAVLEAGDEYAAREHALDQLADPDAFLESIESLVDGGAETVRDEIELSDGRVLDRYVTPLTGEDGTDFGLLLTFRDVTDRKVRERELAAQRALFKAQHEAVLDGVLVVDEDGGIVSYNERFADLWGIPETVLDSRDDAAALDYVTGELANPAEFRETVEYLYDHVGETSRDEIELTDGRVFDRYTTPLVTEDGTYRGRLWTFRDITDRIEREAALERQNERLEEFASIVSHDLRNPLGVAMGRLDLAMEDAPSEHHEPIARALERMEALIDDLLTLARDGESVDAVEAVDLREVADQSWANVRTDATTLEVRTESVVLAHRSRLKQLLENLFRNAVEHGGDGLTVTVGDIEGGFFVADDGPGIPAGGRERVFEPGHSTRPEGTGFGLPIVRQIAEAHGWTVRLTDGVGGGAQFEFTGVSRPADRND